MKGEILQISAENTHNYHSKIAIRFKSAVLKEFVDNVMKGSQN